MLKQHHSIKVIAASLLTAASFQAFAGLGSLSVHSALGEPFSGSIVVTLKVIQDLEPIGIGAQYY